MGGIAGFVDAVAGGGGLITVPALLMAGLPPQLALGTNKGQSIVGTAMALRTFSKTTLFNKSRARLAFFPALFGAALGSLSLGFLSKDLLRPIIICLLTSVALTTLFLRPKEKSQKVHSKTRHFHKPWFILLLAFGIAFYDGFFGPGTGVFFISVFVYLLNDRFREASANAKLVNFASNAGALIIFSMKGWVVWPIAGAMAIGQTLGGFLGAHVTIRRGERFVRYVVVAVCLLLVFRLALEML